MSPLEQEFKFALSETEFARLQAALDPAERVLLQENHYFDTAAGALRARGYGLRLRIENGARRVLTLKGPPRESRGERSRGMHQREEIEMEIPPETTAALLAESPRLDALGLDLPAGIREALGPERLVALGRTDTRRSVHQQTLPGCGTVEMELDEVRFAGGETEYELEVEWLGNRAAELDHALHTFLKGLGIPARPQPESKLARLFHRLGIIE